MAEESMEQEPALDPGEFDHCMATLTAGRALTLDDDMRATWWEAVNGIEGPVLYAAVKRLIADDEGYPTLGRVLAHSRAVAKERLAAVSEPAPPAGLAPDAYIRWLKGWRRAVLRGKAPDEAECFAVDAARDAGALRRVRSSAPTAEIARF